MTDRILVDLQWSHGFSAMDTAANDLNDLRERTRLQWSHGFSAMDTSKHNSHTGRTVCSFNGATAFQPWIPGITPFLLPPYLPFNGATAFQPWILVWPSPDTDLSYRLQWSHGFSAMDTS